MEVAGTNSKGRIFMSCKKEKHYSKELTLQQHAMVHIFSGEMHIAHADQLYIFTKGDTILIPRNQLGRMSKRPQGDIPFQSVSILFPEELLRQFYSLHPVEPPRHLTPGYALQHHPLLESLFTSLLPYFQLSDELPDAITEVKLLETLTIIQAIDMQASQWLSRLDEPGKIDLADFMEKNFMFNLTMERFGYLTGRSLSTFKKDFQHTFQSTPGKWLTQKRLELAHYQIFEQKRKPSDVFMDVGFENLSHFSFAFKKHFGYNPTDGTHTALAGN